MTSQIVLNIYIATTSIVLNGLPSFVLHIIISSLFSSNGVVTKFLSSKKFVIMVWTSLGLQDLGTHTPDCNFPAVRRIWSRLNGIEC